ncbi:hypothetical protein EJ04DRAFT_428061 [Polyplosphaeria fusca]|uniref:Nuclear pore complex protein n=1 Tax=Polyplosphaeria fusca TaxID=682080 RepID=A0A9P4R8E0_9PLEO|nr:hypothetical protein EJ04DRAFT_428061 [Polyplosphaeria fusca]
MRGSLSRSTIAQKDDPLQPLRAMADRIGKEVEKFAEKVDNWSSHGATNDKSNYDNTLSMVGQFRDLAEESVKELKKQNEAENQGELDQSVRRRIQKLVDAPRMSTEGNGKSGNKSAQLADEPVSQPGASKVPELRQWESELATWELLQVIIDHYYPEPGTVVAAEKRSRLAKVGGAYRYSPNYEIWNRFLLEDDPAKEKDIILRWLERSARTSESDIQSIYKQLEEQAGKDTNSWTSGWLDSRSHLKQMKRLQRVDGPVDPDGPYADNMRSDTDSTLALVTQLDPDAPTRQQRGLEKSDETYEKALWMVIYEMIRRGTSWQAIAEWCKDRNEHWRAVSIGASVESLPEGIDIPGLPNVSGPNAGYIFRRMCLYTASGERSPYEAAAYGLLSGSVKEVLPVCRSWEDHLYARYSALLLSRFDKYLINNHPNKVSQTLAGKFVFQDATADISSWENSSTTVIDLLMQHKTTSHQARAPLKLIQGCLISRTIDDLFYKVGLAVAAMLKQNDELMSLMLSPDTPSAPRSGDASDRHYQALVSDPHGLRVLTHVLVVFYKCLTPNQEPDSDRRRIVDNVLAAYIEFLRTSGREMLVPLYASQLSPDRQIHCLARVLSDVKSAPEQKRFIVLMSQYRTNAVAVLSQHFTIVLTQSGLSDRSTKHVSSYEMLEDTTDDEYLWPCKRISGKFAGLELDPKDEALIQSLQWWKHTARERRITFIHLADALRYFLVHGRMGAAIKLVNEISVESISESRTEAYCGYPFDFNQPGAEEQDSHRVPSLRRSSSRSAVRPAGIPSAEEHEDMVLEFRKASQTCYELQQLVRAIISFREWREEEERIIQSGFLPLDARLMTDAMFRLKESGNKVSSKRIKDLLEAIESILDPLLASFLTRSATGKLISHVSSDPLPDNASTYAKRLYYEAEDFKTIIRVYIPEVLMVYVSVLHSASWLVTRETTVKAMNLANIVADADSEWIQKALLESRHMKSFVDELAVVSRSMLVLGERDDKNPKKKRGGKGETFRIWDVNTVN